MLKQLTIEEIKQYADAGYKCGLSIPVTAISPGTEYCNKSIAFWYESEGIPKVSRYLCEEHAKKVR